MLPVIIGKSKTAVTHMPSNLLVVGGSFTGRLKIYDRDTLQEVTGVDTSAFIAAVMGLTYLSGYIYVGISSVSGNPKLISMADKSVTSGSFTGLPQVNCLCADSDAIYYSSISRLFRRTAAGVATGINKSGVVYRNPVSSGDYIYTYTTVSSPASYKIRRNRKSDMTEQATLDLAGSAVRVLTVDSNFLYFGSTTSGDFHVYDLALTVEQTGYPTIPGGIYSILNDDTNVYIGSDGGNIYVINKATKALTTIATGLGADIVSLSQTSDLLYASSASGIVKIGKSNLSTVYSVLSGLSSINTIMVI